MDRLENFLKELAHSLVVIFIATCAGVLILTNAPEIPLSARTVGLTAGISFAAITINDLYGILIDLLAPKNNNQGQANAAHNEPAPPVGQA